MRVKLDARHLLCPMPVIRVQNRVAELAPGTILEVVCTDPGVLIDIPVWCRISGHHLPKTTSEDDEYTLVLEVGEQLT